MSLPPIIIHLSKFEQIEILRAEIEKRQEEMRHAEKQMKEELFEVERQRYLQTIHAAFRQLEPPPLAASLPQLESNREILHDAIQHMQAALTSLEAETIGQTAPAQPQRLLSSMRAGGTPQGAPQGAPPAGIPRRTKFDF